MLGLRKSKVNIHYLQMIILFTQTAKPDHGLGVCQLCLQPLAQGPAEGRDRAPKAVGAVIQAPSRPCKPLSCRCSFSLLTVRWEKELEESLALYGSVPEGCWTALVLWKEELNEGLYHSARSIFMRSDARWANEGGTSWPCTPSDTSPNWPLWTNSSFIPPGNKRLQERWVSP